MQEVEATAPPKIILEKVPFSFMLKEIAKLTEDLARKKKLVAEEKAKFTAALAKFQQAERDLTED